MNVGGFLSNKKRGISFLRATLRYERKCLCSEKKKLDNELGKCGSDWLEGRQAANCQRRQNAQSRFQSVQKYSETLFRAANIVLEM